jgi:hypothetical protein
MKFFVNFTGLGHDVLVMPPPDLPVPLEAPPLLDDFLHTIVLPTRTQTVPCLLSTWPTFVHFLPALA